MGCALLAGCGTPEARRALVDPPAAATVETIKAAPTPMDTFRALAPPEGMKFTPLFATPVRDTDERMQRVEDAVQTLRNDFDTVVPSLVRLVAVEKDMKDLIGQLKAITGEEAEPAAPVATVEQSALVLDPAPAPAPAVGAVEAKKPVPALAPVTLAPKPVPPLAAAPADIVQTMPPSAEVRAVTFSDAPGRTLVVLHLSARPVYSASLQDGGRMLVIDLPRAIWTGKPLSPENGALVAGFRHEDRKFHIDLKSPATIGGEKVEEVDGGFRLTVELVK